MNGSRIAILGAGRSGLAVARAAKALGATPTVYDAKPIEKLGNIPETLKKEGLTLQANFDSQFLPKDTDILVTSPGVDMRSDILQEAVKCGIEVIGEIEFAYRISKAPIVAITGTNGKSTTTVMTWLCLREQVNAKLCGNIYGSGYPEVPITEAAANSELGQVLVAEVSSFQLEWVKQFKPACAAITNIVPDHLNRYDSFEQYADTKRRIYSRMGKGDTYVYHNDEMTAPRPDTPFQAARTNWDQDSIYLQTGKIARANLNFKEEHNVANSTIALMLSEAFLGKKSDLTNLARGLQDFNGLGHRMEFVGERGGVKVVNNSMCTNPSAVVASSKSVHAHQHLLMGGMTKGLDFAPVKNYLRFAQHDVYIFGVDSEKINLQLGGVYPVFRTMGEAFNAAIKSAKAGDVLMLAPGCASLDQYEDFRARGDELRHIAKEWLTYDPIAAH